ncbi:dipeptide ABC transporter ATP-binding protein [Demequina flava]|uniref:dipeptide ABC transporter ATP-binding protein n=1 Tax=Demequina flava TaxID=1095025 RepID=UPI0007848EA8|nr:ABC transporter ATP-binding protein [Demequina flava]
MTQVSRSPLLEVRDLDVEFTTGSGVVKAVSDVNFSVYPGETVAVVGESGSGKSTTSQAVIGMLASNGRVTRGSIAFNGKDLTHMSARDFESIRGSQIGYVPQDPMSSLNPVWPIGFQVEETLRANTASMSRADAKLKAVELLEQAGLGEASARTSQYPHQFSGGMRQRVLIGIGMSARPQLLIADEPTSALDVTVQRRILDHLKNMTSEHGTAMILITHDLGVAAERADRLVVMYRGKVVEAGPSVEILSDPRHPYTKRLIAAAPSVAARRILTGARSVGTSVAESPTAVIDIQDVRKVYALRGRKKAEVKAVDGVSIGVPAGTTTAIVGESGSGKSTLAKMVLGLEKSTSGTITVGGQNIGDATASQMLQLRRRIQPVFQDPYGTLDPQYSVRNTVIEPLAIHGVGTPTEREHRAQELMNEVALPQAALNRYPNELSGGQRQRVAIARALALKPEILVLDEAVSALDVIVQDQILRLLDELQRELDLTYLFITHDLAVVRMIADRVAVMEKGLVVEQGRVDDIFDNPSEEYTKRLLDAIPVVPGVA